MQTCSTISPDPDGRPEWSATTPLMRHQCEAVEKLSPLRVGALFMEMGTGKSRTVIEFARLRQGKTRRVIWFCPVSLKSTIAYEIRKHTDCRDRDLYVFDHRTREETVPLDRIWYVVGIESMSSSARTVYSLGQLVDDRTFVIVDESSYIKGHRALRTERITLLSEKARYRMILTGTPVTQGIVDLWAQMRFLSPKILQYRSFYSFERNHLVYSKKFPGMVVGVKDYETIVERINPYVYQVTKAECLDLPEKLYEDRSCDLTAAQNEAYRQAKLTFADELLDEEGEGGWKISTAIFRLFGRLQSIASGRADGGGPIENDRIQLMKAVIEDLDASAENHIVIWAKYRETIRQIRESLVTSEREVHVFDGDVPESQREGVLAGWRKRGGCLVASERVGSHGLDLTAASTVLFFSRSFSYDSNIQAEDRCHRKGQEKPVLYVSLWTRCGIEERIREALSLKENVRDRLRRELDRLKGSGRAKLREYILSL